MCWTTGTAVVPEPTLGVSVSGSSGIIESVTGEETR